MGSSTGRFDVGTERLVASPIRGRTDELKVIGASVTAVAQGRGDVLVIEGPPGIGKSRLLDVIGTPATKPIVIGHSFGGLIAQELLANDLAAAAVAIDPAPIKGVKALPLAQLRSTFPVLGNPANKHRTVSLTAKQFHYAFGNTLTEEESDALHAAWTIPGAGRPFFEDAGANFSRHSPAKVDTHKADRGPLLLTSGTEDHTVPLKVTKEVVAMYSHGPAQTDFHIFEGRGHSLTIDNGWKDVADVALQWLATNSL